MELTAYHRDFLQTLGDRTKVTREFVFHREHLLAIGSFEAEPELYGFIIATLEQYGFRRQTVEHAIAQLRRHPKRPLNGAATDMVATLLAVSPAHDFIEALAKALEESIYPAELLHEPKIMQRCGVIKRQQRSVYKGRLWPKIKRLPELDIWEWDREIDAYAYASDRLLTVALSSIDPEEISWLWEPYVPFRKVTLVEGDPEAGKTYLLLAITSAVTHGYCLPDQDGHVGTSYVEPSNVLYITAEDGLADTIRKRAERCDADLDRIFVVPNAVLFPEDLQPFSLARPSLLSSAIEERQAKLVILDPLTAFLGADMDMHRANEVRPIMSTLVTIADKYDCAIVCVRHWTKATGNRAAYRGQGNIDFLAAARSVLAIGESPEQEGLRIMAQSKNSINARGTSIVFQISDAGLEWAGTSTMTADEMSAAQPGRHKQQRQNAMEWLRDFLREGPQPTMHILEAAKAVDMTDKAIRKAKEALGILATKEGNAWYWRLPKFQKWERYAGMENEEDLS
jgi:archaellum biogenesis ATPase FlaH